MGRRTTVAPALLSFAARLSHAKSARSANKGYLRDGKKLPPVATHRESGSLLLGLAAFSRNNLRGI
jgi:hypothetical protein